MIARVTQHDRAAVAGALATLGSARCSRTSLARRLAARARAAQTAPADIQRSAQRGVREIQESA